MRCCRKRFTFAISSPDEFLFTSLLPNLFWENFKNRSTFNRVTGEIGCLKRPICAEALSCWKTSSLEIWRLASSRNCCNSITLRLIGYWSLTLTPDRQISDWCNVNHWWLIDWCCQLGLLNVNVNIVWTGVLSRRLSGWQICVQLVIPGVVKVNMFSSVNKMMLTLLCEYFSATLSRSESCVRVRCTQLSGTAICQHKDFTR